MPPRRQIMVARAGRGKLEGHTDCDSAQPHVGELFLMSAHMFFVPPVLAQGQEIDAGGDVIVAVNGEQLVGESDLPRLISLLNPGDTVTLEIIRDGEHQDVEVTLGERADSS